MSLQTVPLLQQNGEHALKFRRNNEKKGAGKLEACTFFICYLLASSLLSIAAPPDLEMVVGGGCYCGEDDNATVL